MQIYLLLNHDCNLNCSFCIRGHSASHKFVDINDLSAILQKNDFSNYYLLLTGGEPTLHPDLAEIIKMCEPYFKGIAVNTNGRESSWIDKCKNNQFHIQISLDGTEELHNQIRGNGECDIYSEILKTIQKINAYNISYNISTTVGKYNYENVKILCDHICRLPNIRYWKVSPLLPFGCANENNVISISKWNVLVEYLLNNAKVHLQIKRLFDFELLDKYMKENPNICKFPKSNCGDVNYKIYVYPDFTVYPCTCLVDFPLGNLLDHSLSEILNNSFSQLFSNYSVKKDSLCYSCKYLPICNGGCIGMSYHYFKELGKGDYRCPLIQEKLHII